MLTNDKVCEERRWMWNMEPWFPWRITRGGLTDHICETHLVDKVRRKLGRWCSHPGGWYKKIQGWSVLDLLREQQKCPCNCREMDEERWGQRDQKRWWWGLAMGFHMPLKWLWRLEQKMISLGWTFNNITLIPWRSERSRETRWKALSQWRLALMVGC